MTRWWLIGVAAYLLLGRNRASEARALSPEAARVVEELGFRVVDPFRYPRSEDGFRRFLRATGIRRDLTRELLISSRPEEQAEAGYPLLLPPQKWWTRGAALAAAYEVLSDAVEAAGGEAATINYWWRPDSAPESDEYPRPGGGFNAQVGGKPNGDHPAAHAADLKWHSRSDADVAKRIIDQWYEDRTLRMGIGYGDKFTHVGFGSPVGHRRWTY